jgi:hypothetical protein
MAAFARTPVLPKATTVGVLSALLRPSLFARRPTALDPLLNAELVELVKKLERPADIAAVKMFIEAMLSRR